jgi:hypothetical protein
VAAFDEVDDARAVAALLAAPPLVAWLGALAEPARGGYRRHLAWTVALLPFPRDWPVARARLAPLVDAAASARTRAVLDLYGLTAACVAPLLAWDAATAPRAEPRAEPRAVREHPPAFAVRRRARTPHA